MKLQALKPIKHDGKRYKVGETVEVKDKKQAQRLINLRAAIIMVAVSFVDESNNGLNNNGNLDSNNSSDDSKDTTGTEGNSEDDELGSGDDLLTDEEVFQQIWDGFKLEVLKEEAAELNLEFPGNISKTDLIKLIIEKEKEDHFLDLIEE